jgi:pSer/pThr/pTyr-binding forkhead associated (FHA) protein
LASGDAYLRVMSGNERGEEHKLDPEREYVIGRSRSSDIRLTDPTVSGSHARLQRRGETWFVTDLDSSHGTRVNKQRLLTEKPLFDRDVVWLGKTLLQFREYEELDTSILSEVDRGVKIAERPATGEGEE